ncbi:MAG: right-handed parallel beta-helix repeat-containing protein [Ilumatobacteraceae bacterium]
MEGESKHSKPRLWFVVIAATVLGSFLVACGSGDSDTSPTSSNDETSLVTTDPADSSTSGNVLEVPAEFSSIQQAVDAAREGDLILVSPGTYNEAVQVTTDNLVIRGLDRNQVILDGKFELDNGIRVVGASGVAIENMTAMNYTRNGFFWTGATGYRGSFLTAWRNGDYGIYAFDSVGGLLENSYAAGSPDAGFYIGQCFPCDAVIRNVISEHNGLGYSGTNSGGNLVIVDSIFRRNRAGIVPNSGSYELCYPERQTTIVGNRVYSNNQPDTPAIDVAILAMGNGILSAGGVQNIIERNRVWDHAKTGIGLVPFLEEAPNDVIPDRSEWDTTCAEAKKKLPVVPDGALLWDSQDNMVRGNVLEDNRVADLAVGSAGSNLWDLGNCFEDNIFTTSAPTNLVTLSPCSGPNASGDWATGDLNVLTWLSDAETAPPSVDWKIADLPSLPVLESMPDASSAPAIPASMTPPSIDLARVAVPDKID